MVNNALTQAIGTLHCPYCQMPLFANPFHPADAAAGPALSGRLVAPFVMLVDGALPNGADLIARGEAVQRWRPAGVVGDDGVSYADHRNNDFILVTPQFDSALGEAELKLRQIFHAAAHIYCAAVGHLQLRSDLGYQLLRYQQGHHFHEHVDQMVGATAYGQRLVTAILYVNDDYEGGELLLPQQNLVYKPKAGTLILFPSGFCYPHASNQITQGTKYAVVTWFI